MKIGRRLARQIKKYKEYGLLRVDCRAFQDSDGKRSFSKLGLLIDLYMLDHILKSKYDWKLSGKARNHGMLLAINKETSEIQHIDGYPDNLFVKELLEWSGFSLPSLLSLGGYDIRDYIRESS